MLDENEVSETFQLVSGISDPSGVRRFNRRTESCFDVDAVIIAAFADSAVFGNNRAFERPCKFVFAIFAGGWQVWLLLSS